jgi:GNAT superfamily N-acetyltransferase
MTRDAYSIRPLRAEDLPQLVDLCGQLGRPASLAELEERFAWLQDGPEPGLFVAAKGDGTLLGWLHVQERPALHTPRLAEVTALVVDAAHRRTGCGRALMEAAERWARDRRCRVLALRSGLEREDAHRFYGAMGFERESVSYKLTKLLGAPS